jgi:hypothetical protein
LQRAVYEANNDVHIHRIVFKRHAKITLSSPVVYTGSQSLTLQGNGALIDGSNDGDLVFLMTLPRLLKMVAWCLIPAQTLLFVI